MNEEGGEGGRMERGDGMDIRVKERRIPEAVNRVNVKGAGLSQDLLHNFQVSTTGRILQDLNYNTHTISFHIMKNENEKK